MTKYCLIPDFCNRRPHPSQKIVMYSFLNQKVNLVSLTILLLMNFKLAFDTDREFLELQHPISEQHYVGDGQFRPSRGCVMVYLELLSSACAQQICSTYQQT